MGDSVTMSGVGAWITGTSPPPGPGLVVRGVLGYLHAPASRALVGVLAGWTLVRQGHLTTVQGTPSWIALEGTADAPPPAPDTPLRVALVAGQTLVVGEGTVQDQLAWQWRSHAPLTYAPDALDDWPLPAAATVALPDGHAWRVRALPRRRDLLRWQTIHRREGPTHRTWHALLCAYDGGWTLPVPSPAQMRHVGGWQRVPEPVTAAIVDYLAGLVAATMGSTPELPEAA